MTAMAAHNRLVSMIRSVESPASPATTKLLNIAAAPHGIRAFNACSSVTDLLASAYCRRSPLSRYFHRFAALILIGLFLLPGVENDKARDSGNAAAARG